MVILLAKVFRLMAWFSLWVREVPNWILEMPNLTKGVSFRLLSLDWFTNLSIGISLTRAFGLVAWFSLWVRQVPSSILGMPHLIHLSKTCLSSVLETWFLHKLEHGSMTLNAPLLQTLTKGVWVLFRQIVNGFLNSKNIVELPSSILGQPYLNCLEKGCLRSVCKTVMNLQTGTWL